MGNGLSTGAGVQRRVLGLALLFGAISWMVWLFSVAGSGFSHDVDGNVLGADHSVFHTAGRLVATGRGADLYDTAAFTRELELVRGQEVAADITYLNPPAMAFLYAPTSAMSPQVSWAVWSVFGLVALALALRYLGMERPWLVLLLLVGSLPGLIGFRLGQPFLVWAALLVFVFGSLERDRYVLAGGLAGLAVLKPQFALPLALWWLLAGGRYRRALGAMTVSGGILSIIAFAAVPGSLRGFWRASLEAAGTSEFPGGFSLRDAGQALLQGAPPSLPTLVLAIAGAAVLATLVRSRRIDLPGMFAATLFVGVLTPSHLLAYDWVLVGVAVIVLWRGRPNQRPLWELVGAGVAVWSWVAWIGAVMLEELLGIRFQPAAFGLVAVFVAALPYLLDPRTDAITPAGRIIPADV